MASLTITSPDNSTYPLSYKDDITMLQVIPNVGSTVNYVRGDQVGINTDPLRSIKISKYSNDRLSKTDYYAPAALDTDTANWFKPTINTDFKLVSPGGNYYSSWSNLITVTGQIITSNTSITDGDYQIAGYFIISGGGGGGGGGSGGGGGGDKPFGGSPSSGGNGLPGTRGSIVSNSGVIMDFAEITSSISITIGTGGSGGAAKGGGGAGGNSNIFGTPSSGGNGQVGGVGTAGGLSKIDFDGVQKVATTTGAAGSGGDYGRGGARADTSSAASYGGNVGLGVWPNGASAPATENSIQASVSNFIVLNNSANWTLPTVKAGKGGTAGGGGRSGNSGSVNPTGGGTSGVGETGNNGIALIELVEFIS